MRNPLPVQELADILGGTGFVRLYEAQQVLFVSDAPRRASGEALTSIVQSLNRQGFTAQISAENLLLIDLQPARFERLLCSFPRAQAVLFPEDDRLLDVAALARLLLRHPSPLREQPMEMIRAVLKQYARRDGLLKLAPFMLAQCALNLRNRAPLPSALADVLAFWLSEQKEEARI